MAVDLTHGDIRILRALCHCTKPVSQNALASRTGLAVNTVRTAAARLARAKILDRRRRHKRIDLVIGDGELARFYRGVFQQEGLLLSRRHGAERELAAVLEATEDLNRFVHSLRAANR